ncbi:MAG: MFS transporter [bacterium]
MKKVFNTTVILMLVMVVFVGVGEKLADRFLPLYLGALGAGAIAFGALNALINLLGAVYSYLGGWLSDRFGYRRALGIFTIMASLGYAVVIAIPHWWAVFAGALFFGAWTAISLPAVMSLISKTVPENRRALGVSIHALTKRIPMALGPVLGGLLIVYFSGRHGESLGTVIAIRVAFAIAMVLALIAAGLMWRFAGDDGEAMKKPAPLRESWRYFTPKLRVLLVADMLVRFAEQLPYAFLAVWVCRNLAVSELKFGWLTFIEMLTAMLVYLPVAWLADRGTKKPYVVITFGFFTLFPMVLWLAGWLPQQLKRPELLFPLLVAAFIIRGLKELGEPTRKSLILDLAPEHAKAATFGTYYLIRDGVVSVVALAAGFLWNLGPLANFATAAGFGLLGTIYFACYGRDLGGPSKSTTP